VAAIFGALLTMILAPQIPRDVVIRAMLTRILRAEILEKPGRTYTRRRRHGNRGKGKGKGNTRARYERRKQRRAEAKHRHPD
jgi:hypothetical protein